MDASQLINADAAGVMAGNNIYNTYQDQWKYLYESYIGGEEYRNAGHLFRYQLETPGEYSARLETTPLENHCRSVISVYTSFLFREQPVRELGSLENSPGIEDFLRDADHDGRSLTQFMKEASIWSSVFGHAWIMCVKPDIGAISVADEMDAEVRPYLTLLTPLVVTDWNWYRKPNGKYVLDYFKYVEDVNGNVRTIKEWSPDFIRTYTVDMEEEIILESYEEVNPLGWIPAICAYNARSTVRGLGISDIADIADAQKLIYNATSEAVESIKLDTHPSLVATPETNVGTGAGALIHMPDNLDPGLKPYALEFSGASIESIYKSINHTIEAIDKMANTGAVRATEAKTMSGVAMETEFQLLNAKLSEKADQMELAEEQIWKFYAYYQNSVWDGVVDYPGSFNIRDNSQEIQQLRTARESATDPRVLKEIDKRILEWMEVEGLELDQMEHPVTTSENRQDHINQMIMEGITDEQILQLHPEITQADIDSAKQALLT